MVVGTVERRAAEAATPRRGFRIPRSSVLVKLAALAALVAVAAVITVGWVLARAAQEDILEARTTIHQTIVDGFVAEGLLPVHSGNLAALDDAVDLRLLGGETVRVKLWDPNGTVVYSDAPGIIGQRFDLGDNVSEALDGFADVEIDDLDAVENVSERRLGSLIEYYLPVVVDGEIVGAFEIYEESSAFTDSLDEIRRHVWVAVGFGVGALAVAFACVAAAWVSGSDRRRRQAEALLGDVLTAADDERRRIVGALHDDIGQPLYRVLYGLQGSAARIPQADVQAELVGLEGLVRGIDVALRTELRVLHAGLVEGDDLRGALERLAVATRRESSLEVEVLGGIEGTEISSAAATALFRAAQEAVINARKHADATRITIDLRSDRTRAVVVVEDDGRGWNETSGMGLATTRQRLASIGGTLRIRRRSPSGTRFIATVPVVPSVVAR